MTSQIDIDWLVKQIDTPTIKGITFQIIKLIDCGEIPIGSSLPPIKELAKALNISPATLSAVWKTLRQYNMIQGIGRQGLTIINKANIPTPTRFSNESLKYSLPISLDLTKIDFEPQLFPDWEHALTQLSEIKDFNIHRADPILPFLQQAIEKDWPYETDNFITESSNFDALSLILEKIILPNSTILIEEPTTFGYLDILKRFKIKARSVSFDEKGPILEKLAQELKRKPVAFIYQPRRHFITSQRIDKQGFKHMAKLFRFSQTLIIELDILESLSDTLAGNQQLSLGKYYPEKTVHIRSYIKSYGPDIGLSILSVPTQMLIQLQNIRTFTRLGWNNRLHQQILAILLSDAQAQKQIKKARNTYKRRYNALIDELNRRGFDLPYGEGFCLWLPVQSEQFALAALAARGINALDSRKFVISADYPPHIRIATTLLTASQTEILAEALGAITQKNSLPRFEKTYPLSFNGVYQTISTINEKH